MQVKWLALGATLMTLAAAAPSSAQSRIPVDVVQTSVDPGDGYGNVPALLSVAFENLAQRPATDAIFDVTDPNGALIARIDFHGKFSPGVTIRKQFPISAGSQDDSVGLVAVRFDDGTVIHNDEQIPARRQASQSDSAYNADF